MAALTSPVSPGPPPHFSEDFFDGGEDFTAEELLRFEEEPEPFLDSASLGLDGNQLSPGAGEPPTINAPNPHDTVQVTFSIAPEVYAAYMQYSMESLCIDTVTGKAADGVRDAFPHTDWDAVEKAVADFNYAATNLTRIENMFELNPASAPRFPFQFKRVHFELAGIPDKKPEDD
jgi:hypothetical protein